MTEGKAGSRSCATEIVDGVPQFVHKLPIDGAVAPGLADLDLTRVFDRLIIGPSVYPWVAFEAFVDLLAKAGVANPADKVVISGIPIRS